jgi:four helix bundle protein
MAKRFEDLDAWKLAEELKEAVFRFTSKPPASKDFKYCDQIRDSARSAPRNIAEGFGRYYPSASLPFYYIALGSLNESFNPLIDGRKREYLSEEEFVRLRRLTFRAIKALRRLVAYLEGAGPRFNRKPNHRGTS